MSALTVGEAMALLDCEGAEVPTLNSRFTLRVAGAELNFAIGLSRLGIDVRWISRVGNDIFGHAILAALQAEGIDSQYVRCDEGSPTGVFFKWRHAQKSSVLYHRKGAAASRLQRSDVSESDLDGVRLVHLTGITMALSDSARDLVLHLARQARARRIPVIFDPNWRPLLWQSPSEASSAFREVLPSVDWVLCSLHEGSTVFGIDDADELRTELLRAGARDVVIRVGAKGAVASGRLIPPAQVVSIVDEVGAGDAFAAGFAYGLIAKWDSARATRLANLMAARSLQGSGDWETLPHRADIASELAHQ
jgi:2-dehydro-3-deoxygluconokinase